MINGENYKRRRKETFSDDEDSCSTDNEPKQKDLNGIITSLLLLEEQEKRDHEEQNEASNEEKSILESNHKRKTRTMLEFYTNLQDYYSEIDETDRVKRKKSRTMAASVAVAAVSQTENQSPNQQNKQSGSGQQRRLWVKDRSKAWWDDCNRPDYPEEEFKKAFRMSKSTFELICEELNSVIAKEDTTLRNAIPVKQRVAVCIWRLATGEPVLMPKYLHWPEEDSLRKIKEEFEGISGIPNVVGSMYTTHIPIIAPKISVAAYFNKRHTERNQKTSYSITVQGVVDPRGVFTDVCIGWPGSMTDDQVLEKSALYQRANGGLLKGVWIVGSSGYPLMDWVLVPYTQQHLTWTQHAFNEKIGEIQKIAKEAFGRLKGRWCCLQKRTEVKLQDLPVVLGACCVLHNICEMMDEGIDPDLKFELADDEMVPEVALKSVSSMKARDAIAHNLLHHGLAGTAFL
ncbi:hypothetical protein Goshw_000040 [Gossypium schwendimanii]|uniref:DDE Tnp4 domain-containing protein n=1 Tax=Gossypium schwendimanii TaxID=34291 RepID=A0A7J9LZ76_GOSSC|nr:hypothetical protein [Gossypium schwendimanii]